MGAALIAAAVLVAGATATTHKNDEVWRPLADALAEYPKLHARELKRLKRGEPSAKFVYVGLSNGLGNREHMLLSAFALALVQKAALFVHWGERGCDSNADGPAGMDCEKAGIDNLYRNPGFDWTSHGKLELHEQRKMMYVYEGKGGKSPVHKVPFKMYQDEHQDTLRRADLSAAPWNASLVVHAPHRFLREILCNPGVAESGLFPPDQLAAQRALEEYLLAPTDAIAAAAARGIKNGGGCAVGVHLRAKKAGRLGIKGNDQNYFQWTEAEVWPRLRKALAGQPGGLFIAADGHSQGIRARFVAAARREKIAIVEPEWKGVAPSPAAAALAENHVLSRCAHLVPTDPSSTFFTVAAVRAASSNPRVRAVYVCPATVVEASPLSPFGQQQPCFFETTCPDPSVKLARTDNQYGYSVADKKVEVNLLKLNEQAGPHPPLDAALAEYPALHARELDKVRRGDETAKIVMVAVSNGLGNREHAVVSSFALALHLRAALFVNWEDRGCDLQADGMPKGTCAEASFDDLFQNPGFDWQGLRLVHHDGGNDVAATKEDDGACGDTSWRAKKSTSKSCTWVEGDIKARCGLVGEDGRLASDACPATCENKCHGGRRIVRFAMSYHGSRDGGHYIAEMGEVLRAKLSKEPWSRTVLVHVAHRYLREVFCNAEVAATGLFPRDPVFAQARLETFLLRPAPPVVAAVTGALQNAGGCAVGIHLRSMKWQHRAKKPMSGGLFDWTPAEVWPKLRAAVAKRSGGLFIATDGHAAGIREQLVALARRDNVTVVEPDWAAANTFYGTHAVGGTMGGIEAALAENHLLSHCKRLVPTDGSTFFSIAAVRATLHKLGTARHDYVCSDNGRPCLFGTTCPDPEVGFGEDEFHYGYVAEHKWSYEVITSLGVN